jgi:hypothetical protein
MWRAGHITETNRIHLVLFVMQNRTSGPYLAAIPGTGRLPATGASMKAVGPVVGRQPIVLAIQAEPCLGNSIGTPAHDRAKIWTGPILRVARHRLAFLGLWQDVDVSGTSFPIQRPTALQGLPWSWTLPTNLPNQDLGGIWWRAVQTARPHDASVEELAMFTSK